MKSTLLLLATMLLLPGVPVLAEESDEGVAWARNYKEALRIAKQEHRPVMLDFWTTWCGPCLTMEKTFWPDPKVTALTRNFVALKIDADREPAVAARHRVSSYPTLLFLDPWGDEMIRLRGFDRNKTLLLLTDLPVDFSSIAEARARADKDKNPMQSLLEIGRFYDEYELYRISIGFYERAAKTGEAKKNPAILAELMTSIGWNYLKIGENRKARKTFERCLKKSDEHTDRDMTIYGLFNACLSLDDNGDAEVALERLRADYPDSDLIEYADRDLAATEQ